MLVNYLNVQANTFWWEIRTFFLCHKKCQIFPGKPNESDLQSQKCWHEIHLLNRYSTQTDAQFCINSSAVHSLWACYLDCGIIEGKHDALTYLRTDWISCGCGSCSLLAVWRYLAQWAWARHLSFRFLTLAEINSAYIHYIYIQPLSFYFAFDLILFHSFSVVFL